MNLLPETAEALIDALATDIEDKPDLDVVVFPPTALIPYVKDWVAESPLRFGAQNCWYEVAGAYTGETSPELLHYLGCDYCLVGHSERREIFGESNELVGRKAQALIKMKITPIICVGETLTERESGEHLDKIRSQVESVFDGLEKAAWLRPVFAYEPIWAIGTGKTATPEQAEEIQQFIRKVINDRAGEVLAAGMSILYGGSAKPSNAADLLRQENIDGLLVGGASLKASDFIDIVNAFHV